MPARAASTHQRPTHQRPTHQRPIRRRSAHHRSPDRQPGHLQPTPGPPSRPASTLGIEGCGDHRAAAAVGFESRRPASSDRGLSVPTTTTRVMSPSVLIRPEGSAPGTAMLGTAAIPGSAANPSWRCTMRSASAGALAPPAVGTRISTGPTAPGPNPAASCSKATRGSVPSGSVDALGWPSTIGDVPGYGAPGSRASPCAATQIGGGLP